LGPLLYGRSAPAAFLAAGGLLGIGALLVYAAAPRVQMRVDLSNAAVRARAAVSLRAVFAYGFAESALLSLYPSFLLARGVTFATTGLACSAFVWGGAMSTFPVATLADRCGRSRALGGCAIFGSVAAALLACAGAPWALLVGSTFVGAGFGPMYALALALMGDRLDAADLPAGSSAFTSSFAVGCIAGPIVTALSMHFLGASTVFVPTIGLFLLVAMASLSPPRRAVVPIASTFGAESSR
jgi:MFS family permease